MRSAKEVLVHARRFGRFTISLLAAVVAFAGQAAAQCQGYCEHYEDYIKWCGTIEYAVNFVDAPTGWDALDRIELAMDIWCHADASGVTSLWWEQADYHPWYGRCWVDTNDQKNTILWLEDWDTVPTGYNPAGAFALTRVHKDTSLTYCWMAEADTYFNDSEYYWYDAPLDRDDPRQQWEDVLTTALHETGHWLRLKDLRTEAVFDSTDCSGCVMWGSHRVGLVRHTLGLGDKWGCCHLYGGTGIGDLKSFDVYAGNGYVEVLWEMWSSGSYWFELYGRQSGSPYVLLDAFWGEGPVSFDYTDYEVINGVDYSYVLWVDDGFSSVRHCTPTGATPLAEYNEIGCAEEADGMEVEWTTSFESASLDGFDVYRSEWWDWLPGGPKLTGAHAKLNDDLIPASHVPGTYSFSDTSALHGRQYSYLVKGRNGPADEERAGPACNPCWRPHPQACELSFADGPVTCGTACPAGDGSSVPEVPDVRLEVTLRDSCGFPVEDFDDFYVTVLHSGGGNLALCCADQQPTVESEYVMLPTAPTNSQGEAWVDVYWAGGSDTLVQLTARLSDHRAIAGDLFAHVTSPDLDGNCEVGLSDFGIFTALYLTDAWEADFDCNGQVGLSDLGFFAAHYGHSCGSSRTQPVPPELLAQLRNRPTKEDVAPASFDLQQNSPNPFNPRTSIRFSVPQPGSRVTVAVFDLAGRIVRTLADGERSPGVHVVSWDGRDADGHAVPSGVYFYRIEAPGYREQRRMVLLK